MSQVVIVSGGSRGLGATIVTQLLKSGHRVATFSRSETDFVTKTAAAAPDMFLFQPVDITDTHQVREFVQRIVDQWSGIDGLVNNAGIAHDGVLAMLPEAGIEQMLDINLKSAILLAKECARQMLTQGRGRIINISSIIAERGFTGLSAYAATKAGMIGFTRSLARELGPRNITVNAIAPGFLETDMSGSLDDRQREQIRRRTPLGRLGTSEDVAPVVEFLLSPTADFITGQVITVDGGSSL